MANLLILDSQPVMRVGIKLLISTRFPGWTVYQFKTASDFFASKLKVVPEMIVLGIDMENENTDLREVSKIRTRLDHSALVICGAHLPCRKVDLMFKSGIFGYISRKSTEKEFIKCFDTVSMGRKYCDLDDIKPI
jgi:DNA-binding NarL/FixJ family response regulator